MPDVYKSMSVEHAFRADVVRDNRLLVELRTIEGLVPVYKAQLIAHLEILNLALGLHINFNSTLLKNGLLRVFKIPNV